MPCDLAFKTLSEFSNLISGDSSGVSYTRDRSGAISLLAGLGNNLFAAFHYSFGVNLREDQD